MPKISVTICNNATVPESCRALLLPFADERKMNQALERCNKNGSPVPLRLAIYRQAEGGKA